MLDLSSAITIDVYCNGKESGEMNGRLYSVTAQHSLQSHECESHECGMAPLLKT